MTPKRILSLMFAAAIVAVAAVGVGAQVGAKGVADLNAIPESELAAMPGMNAGIAKAFVDRRPFATIVEANRFLLDQKVTQEQLNAIYEKAFIPLNLNTATAEEILLVPKIARRMTIEFAEYRPWRTFAQFDREIGKYVGAPETNRLKQFVFIPIDLNTGTDEQFSTIPNMSPRMLIEFKEYRPWKTKEQFDREIGKYVGPKETARLWRYMVINP
jgi:DNA uptake protein ComE-like DNA-binding protein